MAGTKVWRDKGESSEIASGVTMKPLTGHRCSPQGDGDLLETSS